MLQLLFINDLTFTKKQNYQLVAELIACNIGKFLTSKMSVKKPMCSLRNLNSDSTAGPLETGAWTRSDSLM